MARQSLLDLFGRRLERIDRGNIGRVTGCSEMLAGFEAIAKHADFLGKPDDLGHEPIGQRIVVRRPVAVLPFDDVLEFLHAIPSR